MATTRTPHLPARSAALCRPCADAFERARRLERRGFESTLCEECAELPADVRHGALALCHRCASAAERFRAKSHAWLTRRVGVPACVTERRAEVCQPEPWADERW